MIKGHDSASCPQFNQDWHEQAPALAQGIESIPSKQVIALMQQDLIDLLNEQWIQPGFFPSFVF